MNEIHIGPGDVFLYIKVPSNSPLYITGVNEMTPLLLAYTMAGCINQYTTVGCSSYNNVVLR